MAKDVVDRAYAQVRPMLAVQRDDASYGRCRARIEAAMPFMAPSRGDLLSYGGGVLARFRAKTPDKRKVPLVEALCSERIDPVPIRDVLLSHMAALFVAIAYLEAVGYKVNEIGV